MGRSREVADKGHLLPDPSTGSAGQAVVVNSSLA